MKGIHLLLPLMMAAAACSGGEADVEIVMIAKSSTNPVFQAARRGAEERARALEQEHGLTIDVDWQTPENEDAAVQAKRVRAAAVRQADAVLVSCIDAGELVRAIDDAVQQGVPVMTFDSDAPGSARFAYVGPDNRAIGVELGRELARILNGSGKVAVLAGNAEAPNLQLRTDGLLETLRGYPDIEVIGIAHNEETAVGAAAVVLEVMSAAPDIAGWAMLGGWALFDPLLLKTLDPARVKIVAVDALPEQLDYVDAGLAPVLLAQPVYDWGSVSVNAIYDKLVLEKEVPRFIPLPTVRVTAENLGSWARQLKSWGFEVPARYLDRP